MLTDRLPVSGSVCLEVYACACQSVSVTLRLCLSVCLSVRPSVSVSVSVSL